jgi:antitoxin CcdA
VQQTQGEIKHKKKPTNLSVRVDLLQVARADDLNLSGMLENCLLDYSRKKRERVWLEENRAGIEAYNERIERNGVFALKHRNF